MAGQKLTTRAATTTTTTTVVPGGQYKIQEITVGAGGQATIDFSAIPQTYKHLHVTGQVRGDTAAVLTLLHAQVNGDTGANYDWEYLNGPGGNAAATAAQGSDTSMALGYMNGGNAPAVAFGQIALALDYYAGTTAEKTLTGQTSAQWDHAAGNQQSFIVSGFWHTNASPITRLTLYPAAGNFAAGTVVTLYGIDPTAAGVGVPVSSPGELSRVALDYTTPTTADIFVGTAVTVSAWTTVLAAQTFTVKSASSLVEIAVSGNALIGNTQGNDFGLGLFIDGVFSRLLGGGPSMGANFPNMFAGVGPVVLSTLAVGSHTVSVQVYSDVAAAMYLRPNTRPNEEFGSIRVIERQPQGAVPAVGGAPSQNVVLNYVATSDVAVDLAVPAATWTNIGPSNNFTVVDPTSLLTAYVDGKVGLNPTGSLVGEAGSRLLIDGTTAIPLGGAYGNASVFGVPVGLPVTTPLLSLLAGAHTVQLQVYAASAAQAECRVSSTPPTYALNIRIVEQRTVALPASALPQATSKVQLDWAATTDLFSNQAIPATTWTDLLNTTQTFSVDDPASLVDVAVRGFIQLYGSVSQSAVRVVVDGTITRQLGGDNQGSATAGVNLLAGAAPFSLSGLAAGSHTVKLQAYTASADNVYCRAATVAYESLAIQVIERKQVSIAQASATIPSPVTSKLAADVALTTANTFYDGPSVTVPAGTWFLSASATAMMPGVADHIIGKLWDGTTSYTSGQVTQAANYDAALALTAVVSPTATTTYKLSVASYNGGATLKAATPQDGSGTNATQITAVPIPTSLNIVAQTATEPPYVQFTEQYASGSAAVQASTSWYTRNLNTINANAQGLATLASKQITLPAGTYRCQGSVPGFYCTGHQARLRDVTHSATLIAGTSENIETTSSNGSETRSFIKGRFTLTSSTVIEVQHIVSSAANVQSGGTCTGFGEVATLAEIELWKVA